MRRASKKVMGKKPKLTFRDSTVKQWS